MDNKTYKQIIYLAKPDDSFREVYGEAYHNFYNEALLAMKDYCDVVPVAVSDIWVRDFFPLQNPHNKELFRFYYNPLFGDEEDTETYSECREYVDKHYKDEKRLPIWMDGGNLITNGKYGICLDTNGTDIAMKVDKLESSPGITIIVLPYSLRVPDEDPTGHIDGAMQFLGESTLLFSAPIDSDDSEEMKERETWKSIINASTECSLKFIELPDGWGECKHNEEDGSARGIYANFLETEDFIFVPQFNLSTDKEAIDIIQKHTTKKVVGIDCEEISKHGGSLHCLTKELYVKEEELRNGN